MVIFRNFAPFHSCSPSTWRHASFGKIRASGLTGTMIHVQAACMSVKRRRRIAAFVALHTDIRAMYAASLLSFGFFLVLRETLSSLGPVRDFKWIQLQPLINISSSDDFQFGSVIRVLSRIGVQIKSIHSLFICIC